MKVFKQGDYALLQGQLVEILDVIMDRKDMVRYKIKLLNDNLTHWVLDEELEKVKQEAPKVLFSAS